MLGADLWLGAGCTLTKEYKIREGGVQQVHPPDSTPVYYYWL